MSRMTDEVLRLVLRQPLVSPKSVSPEKTALAERRLNYYFDNREMTETQFRTEIWCRTVIRSIKDLPQTPKKFRAPKSVKEEAIEVMTIVLASLGVPKDERELVASLTPSLTTEGRALFLSLCDPTVDKRPFLPDQDTNLVKAVSKAESLLASLPE